MNKYEQLEKLIKLKEQGILSEEEFQREKKNVLTQQEIKAENSPKSEQIIYIQEKRKSNAGYIGLLIIILLISLAYLYYKNNKAYFDCLIKAENGFQQELCKVFLKRN